MENLILSHASDLDLKFMCIPDISNIVKYFRTCNIHEKTVRQEYQWAQNKEVYFFFDIIF